MEEWLFLRRQVIPLGVQRRVEAAGKACVAGAALLLHLKEERVSVGKTSCPVMDMVYNMTV